jgi:hypothetical protein
VVLARIRAKDDVEPDCLADGAERVDLHTGIAVFDPAGRVGRDAGHPAHLAPGPAGPDARVHDLGADRFGLSPSTPLTDAPLSFHGRMVAIAACRVLPADLANTSGANAP